MIGKNVTSSITKGSFRLRLQGRDGIRRANQKELSRAAGIKYQKRNDLSPKLHLVEREPNTLVAPKRNVRGLQPGHIREVANSISVFGFVVPVLIDRENGVVDGLVRVEAAKLLKLQTIACVVCDTLTKPERKLLRIAVNRLGEKGEWTLDSLKLEIEELIIEEAPIEVSGFDMVEIDGILTEIEPAQVETGPIKPDPRKEPVACNGDVFFLGRHRVVCGDATDPSVMFGLMRGEKARMVFTDQPYNVRIAGNVTSGAHREFEMATGEMNDDEFLSFNDTWICEAAQHLLDGGILATFMDWRGLNSVTMAALSAQLSQINLLVWAKTNGGMGSLYRSQHELIPVFRKGHKQHVNNVKLGKNGRWRSNVITHAGASSVGSDARRGLEDHPTVKPVAVLSDILLDLTNRGDIVLDPFLGSGSTLIASEKTGRVCMGVEIDPLYVDLICRRYAEVTGNEALLEETGETFAVLEQRRSVMSPDDPTKVVSTSPHGAPEATALSAPIFRKRTRISTLAG